MNTTQAGKELRNCSSEAGRTLANHRWSKKISNDLRSGSSEAGRKMAERRWGKKGN